MAKTIAVTGATGNQGGSVARRMLEAGWHVRAISRNKDSESAQKLRAQGMEVVQARYDDEDSLVKAFEGAHAIFAVTNFWEALIKGKSRNEAGEIEQAQGKTLALAASKTKSLEHYVWSTLFSGTKASNGKIPVPHLDYKEEVDVFIRQDLPDLAQKTTYLTLGWYPSNIVTRPFAIPVEWPGAFGKHIWIQPADPSTGMIVAGDMYVTPGIWTHAILTQPAKTHGKYVTLATETLSWSNILAVWSEVTGKKASVLQTTVESFVKVWGEIGAEYAAQLKLGETLSFDDWNHMGPGPFVSNEELGISMERIGLKAALERFRDQGVLAVASK